MSVEIMKRSNGEIYISVDGEITKIEEIASYKSISVLFIRNISDSRKLKEFLLRIPLNTVKKLEFISCDLEALDEECFGQLQSVEDIEITQSIGKSYNELLRRIPNKSKVKNIDLENDKESGNDLDVTLLEEFKGLKSIRLKNISGLDMQALQVVLSGVRDLRQFTFEGDIQSLDFISGIDIEHINIRDENLELGLITPDIARAHKNICFDTGRGTEAIMTESIDDGRGYKLQLPLSYITKRKALIDGAKSVRFMGTEKIEINNEEELQELIKNKELLTVPSISIRVPHIGVITPTQLSRLKEDIPISNIAVMDTEYSQFSKPFEYSLEQYEILHSKVQEIVGDIPKDYTDLQKFMIIYKRLGEKIIYDHKLKEEEDKEENDIEYYSDYVRDNAVPGRNLINGLIRNTCVCAGYADILYNCLRTVGIESYKISGRVVGKGIEESGHAWNKVKIDGVWYNVDLTNDCDAIVDNDSNGLELCLRSDKEFPQNYKQRYGKKVPCEKDYSRDEIAKAFEFASRFERGEIALDAEYEVISEEPSLFDKIKAIAMTLFGKRKMLPEATQPGLTEEDKRARWLETSGIEVGKNGGTEQTAQVQEPEPVKTSQQNQRDGRKEPGNDL